VKLWIAQGFGMGRIPFAPGTFGSLVGLLWVMVLLTTGSLLGLIIGTLLGLIASIWLCGEGERILRQKDPGSVVLDEIAAMPVCFASWIGLSVSKTGVLPPVNHFLENGNWILTIVVFVLFRLFDIWKPWPVRQSQALPGGWGITIDDLLAALYVAIAVLAFKLWKT
jgi:phosphatidylglycerophosphatase A